MPAAKLVEFARIAPERTFLSTDMGQAGLPDPLDGMRAAIGFLLTGGVPQAHVEQMVKTLPAQLVGLQ